MYVRPVADPVRLMVMTDQVEQANTLVKDLELSFLGINLGKKTE